MYKINHYKRKEEGKMFVHRRFAPDYLCTNPPVLKKRTKFPEDVMNIANLNELEPSTSDSYITDYLDNNKQIKDCLNFSDYIDADISLDDRDNWMKEINRNIVSDLRNTRYTEREEFAKWACETNQTRASTNQLLSILRKNNENLPKDYRTLCRTPRKVEIKKMGNGDYVHLGLKKCMESYLQNNETTSDNITIDLNIDGVPVAISSNRSLWPVLVSI